MNYKSDSLPRSASTACTSTSARSSWRSPSFDGSVGSSNIQAKGRMDNYLQWWLKDSTLVGSFDLTANKFDLNELMGPSTPEEEPAEAAADTPQMSVIEVPGNIDFRMGMAVKEVIYDKMQP
jgi:hypothetical protein